MILCFLLEDKIICCFFKQWYNKHVLIRTTVLEYVFGKDEPTIYDFSLAVILDPFDYSYDMIGKNKIITIY